MANFPKKYFAGVTNGVVALTIGLLVGGCGGAQSAAREEGVAREGTGEVVDPGKVPSALESQPGLRIKFRPGPTPAGYDRAIYGTAVNARGVKISFAFFLAPEIYNEEGGREVPKALLRLVPGATENGSSAGKSYIMVSNAEYRQRNPKVREEEFEMSANLHWTVAALAPRAIREESP